MCITLSELQKCLLWRGRMVNIITIFGEYSSVYHTESAYLKEFIFPHCTNLRMFRFQLFTIYIYSSFIDHIKAFFAVVCGCSDSCAASKKEKCQYLFANLIWSRLPIGKLHTPWICTQAAIYCQVSKCFSWTAASFSLTAASCQLLNRGLQHLCGSLQFLQGVCIPL